MVVGSINGVESDHLYLIEYPEDLWNSLPAERQEACKDHWRKVSLPLKCTRIALKLVPDTLFPTGSHELPYVAWQEAIERGPKLPFKVSAEVRIKLLTDSAHIDPSLRPAIMAEIAKYPSGTKYEIRNSETDTLEYGRA